MAVIVILATGLDMTLVLKGMQLDRNRTTNDPAARI
jgi:hypothetical protein